MVFKKGQISWNKGLTRETDERIARFCKIMKGHKVTEQTKLKISIANRGKKRSREFIEKMRIYLTGKKHTEETKLKMRLSHLGKTYIMSNEGKTNIRNSIKKRCLEGKFKSSFEGKHHSEETKKKISLANKGQYHPISEKTKEKIGLANKGKVRSLELRKKISLTLKGRRVPEEIKNKIKFTWNTNEYKQLAINRRKNQILPTKNTKIEVKIQMFLKELGYEFFVHQYIEEIKHSYQCDILIPSLNMVIECDGDYWHKYPIGKDIDNIRTKELIEKGFKVLRLWENEIKVMNLDNLKWRMKNV